MVINPNGITVYTGPHTTYPQAKTLAAGKQILLEEVILFDGNVWARCEYGWIRVNSKILLHDENTLAHSFRVVTAVSGLTVRTGPGKNYEKETTLSKDLNGTIWPTDGIAESAAIAATMCSRPFRATIFPVTDILAFLSIMQHSHCIRIAVYGITTQKPKQPLQRRNLMVQYGRQKQGVYHG